MNHPLVVNGANLPRPPAANGAGLPRPPQSIFDTQEAEQLAAATERASNDRSNSIETSRLLKKVSCTLYCALMETTRRAKVRVASVIALDRISARLRRFDQETNVPGMLADTVASVTLMANANDKDEPIELRAGTFDRRPSSSGTSLDAGRV